MLAAKLSSAILLVGAPNHRVLRGGELCLDRGADDVVDGRRDCLDAVFSNYNS